jgi:hypothetical protein
VALTKVLPGEARGRVQDMSMMHIPAPRLRLGVPLGVSSLPRQAVAGAACFWAGLE